MFAMIVGSFGVGLLLMAFIMNLLRRLSEDSTWYLGMNLIGAGLAAIYAYMTGSIPFVILESVWAGAALVRLLQGRKKAPA